MIIRIAEYDYGYKIKYLKRDDFAREQKIPDSYQLRYTQLVNKYISCPFNIMPRAKEIFKAVIKKCKAFAKKHFAYYKAEISLEQLTACVCICVDRFYLDDDDITLLSDIKSESSNLMFSVDGDEIEIKIFVPFFSDRESPMTKAINEIFDEDVF